MDEATFRQTLAKERKRVDRSDDSLLLVLLEVSQIAATPAGPAILDRIKSALRLAVRETDLSGWHSDNKEYGVVFTQLSRAGLPQLTKILLAKVWSALENSLGYAHASQIAIETLCYPELAEASDSGPHPEIYPAVLEDSRAGNIHRVEHLPDIRLAKASSDQVATTRTTGTNGVGMVRPARFERATFGSGVSIPRVSQPPHFQQVADLSGLGDFSIFSGFRRFWAIFAKFSTPIPTPIHRRAGR